MVRPLHSTQCRIVSHACALAHESLCHLPSPVPSLLVQESPNTKSRQYDVLSDEGKSQPVGMRTRHKDDVKEQNYQAREGLKARAVDLKEKIVNFGNDGELPNKVRQGVELAKEKVGLSEPTDDSSQGLDEPEEILEEIREGVGNEWEEVKRKGRQQVKKASQAIDENLSPSQRRRLEETAGKVKKGAVQMERQIERQARGWSNWIINNTLRGQQLRPVKRFIVQNRLQLPAVILLSLLSVWLGLTVIRLLTSVASPRVPEFDINDKDASLAWLKYHAGEFKDRAVDMKDSLSARAASYLANVDTDQMKSDAIDYRDIGLRKLGLTEPTWGEWAWARLTGRPITWQERVESVLGLAKDGIAKVDLRQKEGIIDRVKHMLRPEPTLNERASEAADALRRNMPNMPEGGEGIVEGIRTSLQDGVETIRSHLPDTGVTMDSLKQRATDAVHPSTLDQIKSGANYIKNRVVHGAQEAVHIAQDRANEAADKAKYQAGV